MSSELGAADEDVPSSARTWHYRVRVRLVRERAGTPSPALRRAADIAALLGPEMMHLDREQFVCCHLDVKNRLISREVVSIGHLSAALVHNHPSGDPEPSREDIDLTRRLIRAGEILGIAVLDHVVVATGGHVSVVERFSG